MDNRKVQFLINVQHEIDKLEKSGEDPKNLEKLKATFYDLAGIKDVIKSDIKIGTKPKDIQSSIPVLKDDTDNTTNLFAPDKKQNSEDRFIVVASEKIEGNVFQTEINGKMVKIHNFLEPSFG